MPKKTIIITGATSGIGEQTALELARTGDDVYLLVRNLKKAEKIKRHILVHARNPHVFLIECDLASLVSVKKAADLLKAAVDKVDVLINNAGMISPERQLSKDGFELTFAVNYLSHFLLTMSLMPLLQKAKGRVINISSAAHKMAKPRMDDLQTERSYTGIKSYANSKLFNIYFTQSLAQKFGAKGVTAYSLHPGIVNTKFGAAYKGLGKFFLKIIRGFMVPVTEGAETSIYIAKQPEIESFSGQYFKDKKVAQTASITKNTAYRDELWKNSEELVRPFL